MATFVVATADADARVDAVLACDFAGHFYQFFDRDHLVEAAGAAQELAQKLGVKTGGRTS